MVDCQIFRTLPEYRNILDLTGDDTVLADQVGFLTKGQIPKFNTREEVTSFIETKFKEREERKLTEKRTKESLVKLNPSFIFNYKEREEILNTLLYLTSINGTNGDILPLEEIKQNLKLDNLKKNLEVLKKARPEHAENYDKLLKDNVLNAFIALANSELTALDPSFEEDLDEQEKTSNSNFKDSTEVDHVEKASTAAKLLLRFLPTGQSSKTLGLPTYHNFKKNEKLILETLQDIPYSGAKRNQEILLRLDKLSVAHPQFLRLATKFRQSLDSNAPYEKREIVQFIRAYEKHFESYSTSFVKETEDGSFTTSIGSSDSSSPVKIIQELWENNFNDAFYSEDSKGKISFNKEKAKTVIELIQQFETKYNKLEGKTIEPGIVYEVKALFETVGIELDASLLDAYVNKTNDKYKALGDLVRQLRYISKETKASTHSLPQLIKQDDFGYVTPGQVLGNPIADNSTALKFLAEMQAEFDGDITSSTVYANGKMYQQFTLHNYLSLATNDLNLGEESTHLNLIDQDIFTTNSKWKQELKDGAKISFELFNSVSVEGSNTNDSGELSPVDEFLDRIERIYSGRFPFLTLADKSRVYYLKGFNTIKNITITDEIVKQFSGYFFDELITMQKAYRDLYGENPISPEDMIPYYHTNGNVFTSTVFPSLGPNGVTTKALAEEGIFIYKQTEEKGNPFTLEESSIKVSDSGELEVSEGLSTKLFTTIKGLLEEKIAENKARILEDNITDLVSNEVKSEYNTSNKDELAGHIATVFTLNSLVGNIEQTKLFTGDPRMYKNLEDFLKRTPAVAATGDRLLEGKNVRAKFGVAVIKGFKKSSPIYTNRGEIEKLMDYSQDPDGIANALSLEEYDSSNPDHKSKTPFKAGGKTWIESASKENSFDNINTTDAQGWISFKRAKELISGLTGWSDILEKAYSNIQNRTASKEDYQVFLKAYSLQPKKGMHYELVLHNNQVVPVYLKYSQAVLFPELVEGNEELTRLVELMGDNIDEVVVTDGIKVGGIGVVDIMKEGAKLKRIELSNNFWKLQQDLTADGLKDKLVLSQPKKNMIADILLEEEYAPGYLGKDLLRDLHTTDTELSNIGLHKLQNEIYENGVISEDKVRKKLLKEFKDEKAPQDILQALEDGIALDALPNYRRSFMSKMASWYTKSGARVKQLGGSAIQLADLGYKAPDGKTRRVDSLSDTEMYSVIWLKEDGQELLPPRVELDKEGNPVMLPGQVLLNYRFIEQLSESVRRDPNKLKAAIDKELLRIVASRVPNQKLSFNASIEVVGFLPPHVGDTIVAYKEMVATTGSDFDIDKLYFMLPHYKPSKDKQRLEYIRFLDDSNSTIEERVESLLKNPPRLAQVLEEAFGDTESAAAVVANVVELNKNYSNLWKKYNEKVEDPNTTEEELAELEAAIENQLAVNRSLAEDLKPFIEALPIEKQNSKKAIENRRIELYRKVLESPKSTVRTITAVDNTWLKDFADYIRPPKKLKDLDLYDGFFQMEKRREFIASKGGVGNVANHLGDHALSQEAKLYLQTLLGIGHTTSQGYADLSQLFTSTFETLNSKTGAISDAENVLITEILSVYMNAFVDAAKDNFIGRVNFNFTTNNIAFTLLRAGVSPLFVTALVAQPIIQEYVTKTENNRGLRQQKQTASQILTDLAKKYGSPEGILTEDLSLEGYTTQELVRMIKSPTLELKDRLKQVELLSIFTQLLGPISKDVKYSMDASKADREGAGMNVIDSKIRRRNINRVFSTRVGNFGNKFTSTRGFSTMLGTATANTIDKYLEDTNNMFVETTLGFNYILNEVHSRALGETPLDMEVANKISKLVYGALMHAESNFKLTPEQYKEMIQGPKSLARRLQKLKQAGYGEINEFIDYLTYNINFSEKSPSFISVNNTKSITPKVTEMLTYSWLELYLSSNKTLRDFAVDAAKYSFYSSLFADNVSSFYRLLPYQLSRDLGISSDISNEMRAYLADTNFAKYEPVIDNVLRSLVADEKFTTKTPKKAVLSYFKTAENKAEFSNLESTLNQKGESYALKIVDSTKATNVILSIDPDTNEVSYKPYMRMKEYIKPMTGKAFSIDRYYKLVGTIVGEDTKSHPVYMITNKLGYKRGKYQLYEISNQTIPKSVIDSNNIVLSEDSIKALKTIKNKFIITPKLKSELEGTYVEEIVEEIQSNPLDIETPTQPQTSIKEDVSELFESNEGLANAVYEALGFEQNNVKEFKGFWNRQQVASQTDKVFLFGDNTNDRVNTKYVPTSTQAVIRGLPNAIGIDTKKDRGTSVNSYMTDADFDWFKNHVDSQIQKAKNSGKTIVIPADGIGTGKAMLKEKAPKLFQYLQQELNKLKEEQITSQQKQQAQQQYSQYLDQIFPDSKVKDIVYRGDKKGLNKFTQLDDKGNFKASKYGFNYGIFLSSDKEYVEKEYGEKTYAVLINSNNIIETNTPLQMEVAANLFLTNSLDPTDRPEWEDFSEKEKEEILQEYLSNKDKNKIDTIIGNDSDSQGIAKRDDIKGLEYVVFEPEQIHILGSKQDIEGFKQFVGDTGTESKLQTITDLYTQHEEQLTKNNLTLEDLITHYEELGLEKTIEKIKKCYS